MYAAGVSSPARSQLFWKPGLRSELVTLDHCLGIAQIGGTDYFRRTVDLPIGAGREATHSQPHGHGHGPEGTGILLLLNNNDRLSAESLAGTRYQRDDAVIADVVAGVDTMTQLTDHRGPSVRTGTTMSRSVCQSGKAPLATPPPRPRRAAGAGAAAGAGDHNGSLGLRLRAPHLALGAQYDHDGRSNTGRGRTIHPPVDAHDSVGRGA